ncbi:MAG: AbrB family transcriptional regulator, partial [Alkalispirochaeta sp.]
SRGTYLLKNLRSFTETTLVAFLGVAVFAFLNMPLPWLIGSLLATAIWHISTQRKLTWPSNLKVIAMIPLGYMVGISFTREALLEMRGYLPSMVTVTLLTIAFSLFLGWVYSRITGLDLTSCIMGSIPGGLSQIMILIDEIEGLNPTVIMFLQSMRVMMIVVVLPILTVYLFGNNPEIVLQQDIFDAVVWSDMPWFALILYPVLMFGAAWLFSRLRVPTAVLLGPMVLTVVLTFNGFATPELPGAVVKGAQFFIGVHIGLKMRPRDLPNWKVITLYTFIAVGVLILFGLGLGFALAHIYGIDYPTALLSTAPGGMVEMGITAISVGGDVAVITSHQLFRLLTILVVVPFFFKWFLKERVKKQ